MTFERAAELLGYETAPAWVTGVCREAFIAYAVDASLNDTQPVDPCAAHRARIEVEMFF